MYTYYIHIYLLYRLVKPFMDEVTKSKIQIYSKRSQWEPALLELIEADQLPVRYGGTAPDLTPEECIATLDPPYIAVVGEGEVQVGVQVEEIKVSVCEEYTTTTTSASTSTNSTAAASASATTTTTAV